MAKTVITVADYGEQPVGVRYDDARALKLEGDFTDGDYEHWVFWTSPASLRQELGDRPWPSVYGCEKEHMRLDVEEILDIATQELHEDARDLLQPGAEEALQELLDAWEEKYGAKVVSWFCDPETVVVEVSP